MATVRVHYREAVQKRQYEPLECEMTIEGDSVVEVLKEATPENIRKMAHAFAALRDAGSKALADALAKPDLAGRK